MHIWIALLSGPNHCFAGRGSYDCAMKATVSQKGRVTIPKQLREALGIRAGTTIDFDVVEGALVGRTSVERPPLDELYGSLALEEPVDAFVGRVRDGRCGSLR